MQFIEAIASYSEERPFTSDVNKFRSSAAVPLWFAATQLHVAKVVRTGPYTDPGNNFFVGANQLLIEFEAPQPPAGTPQAESNPRPHWFAILDIDRTFVTTGAPFYKQVDPAAAYVPGDAVAVWFSLPAPAVIVGKFRAPSSGGSRLNPFPGMRGFNL